MVNNSFQHSYLTEKLLVIQPHRCKVKEFQRASGSHEFTKSLSVYQENILFKTHKILRLALVLGRITAWHLRGFKPLEDMVRHEEGRVSWAQTTPGSCPEALPRDTRWWEKAHRQRTQSDVFCSCSRKSPFPCHPHILSLETTCREEKGSKAAKGRHPP